MLRPTVAVAGQTPPPFHGQAIMIESLLVGDDGPVRLVHVPMDFSATLDDVGRFRLGKVAELGRVIGRLWRARWQGARALYYPPAGPNRTPVYRDIAILLATRWLFDTTVFHFHAGGLSEIYPSLPAPLRPLYRLAYGRPDLAIRPSDLSVPDGAFLEAARDAVVPYGIEDPGPAYAETRTASGPVRLVFVAALRESKGVDVLVEATARLVARGHDVETTLVGGFASDEDERRIRALVAARGLGDRVALPGVLTGDAKERAYAEADVFVFPSFYESEAAPLVLVEAMTHRLPIVTTRWRGIPAVVDETCARLVEPRDTEAVVEALEPLVTDPNLRQTMGGAGRRRFEERFTSATYRARMREEMAQAIAASGRR
ncbi:MAG: glycosyltransferase [Bacteroidota bacterium]